MNKLRRRSITITGYMMIWSIIYVVIIAIVLIISITVLTDGAIRGAAREELSHETVYLIRALYINENGDIELKRNYQPGTKAFNYCIYDENGNVLLGELPNGLVPEMFSGRGVKTVRTRGTNYTIMKRKLHLSMKSNSIDHMTDDDIIHGSALFSVNIGKLNTGYRSLNFMLIVVILLATAILIFSQRLFSSRLSGTLNSVRANAQRIGSKIDFSDRMEADSIFLEVNVLIETYNRLLDRMEQTINRERAFNSSVSHELRTPISVIKAECEVAREKQKNGYVNVNEILDLVERQNGRMYALINQLLAISRLEQGRIQIRNDEEIDLAELVEIICEEEAELLELDSPSDLFEMVLAPAKVTADMTLIMTLYSNLVHNAVKYNKKNNKITVQLWKQDGSVFFSVQDWGIGMSEDVRENIFNSFYRAEKSRTSEGFGLGLTMAGRIVEYYEGDIEVMSEEGLGSTFTARLPLQINK